MAGIDNWPGVAEYLGLGEGAGWEGGVGGKEVDLSATDEYVVWFGEGDELGDLGG